MTAKRFSRSVKSQVRRQHGQKRIQRETEQSCNCWYDIDRCLKVEWSQRYPMGCGVEVWPLRDPCGSWPIRGSHYSYSIVPCFATKRDCISIRIATLKAAACQTPVAHQWILMTTLVWFANLWGVRTDIIRRHSARSQHSGRAAHYLYRSVDRI